MFSERPNDLLSTQRSGALRRGETNVQVLILVQNALMGAALKMVVDDYATGVQVGIINKAGDGMIDWTNKGERAATLPEAVHEAEFIILSHQDSWVIFEIKELAKEKLLLGVFAETAAIPTSSISLGLFQEMWPQIAEVVRTRLQTTP